MAHPVQRHRTKFLLRPCRKSLLGTAAETAAIGTGLFTLAVLLSLGPSGATSWPSKICVVLGITWLSCWPAWRLRQIHAHRWWWNVVLGVCRAGGLMAFVSVIGILLLGLYTAIVNGMFWSGSPIMIAFSCLFLPLRALVLLGAFVVRRTRNRLRWQLLASQLAVIVVTLAMLTAAAALTVAILLSTVLQPNDREMSAWLAQRVPRYNSVVDRTNAQRLANQIEHGQITISGEPFLAQVIPAAFAPSQVIVVDMTGRPLAVALTLRSSEKKGSLGLSQLRSTFGWTRARSLALRGGGEIRARGRNSSSGDVLGVAPITDRRGRTIAVAAVESQALGVSQIQFLALAVFGAGTVALVLATALPVLLIAGLFSAFLARSMTGQLEAVSEVTRAIASGDLEQRAPVSTQNEIGGLAASVNRMAAHLSATMAELRQARTQAESALRTRQELVASISHELRTPLAVLRAHLDTLSMHHAVTAGSRAGDRDDVTVPAITLQALRQETERLGSLIDDLFTLSRAEAGAVQLHLVPTDVAALADEVAAVMRPLAQREGQVSLSTEAAPGLPPALADADRLKQILSNLVRNAVRHTPEGGIVALRVAQEDDWVVLSVADTGEGIEPEHLPHIFERLYRVDQARSRDSGGAGLGLAIVREFVELMGGRVTAASVLGEGSCFSVYLPPA
ncbi:MAG TPA: ATP-binding protein [Chloroflexota bacterium]